MSDTESFRIIVIEEGDGMFSAQCLEYDICTQAGTIEQLKERLYHQIEVERMLSREQTGEDFGGLSPAPETFHEMWDRGVVMENGNVIQTSRKYSGSMVTRGSGGTRTRLIQWRLGQRHGMPAVQMDAP